VEYFLAEYFSAEYFLAGYLIGRREGEEKYFSYDGIFLLILFF